jgi:hypothetical protein
LYNIKYFKLRTDGQIRGYCNTINKNIYIIYGLRKGFHFPLSLTISHFSFAGDGETFQILRKILDSKNISLNRKTNLVKSNNNESTKNQSINNPAPVPTNNGSQCPYCRRVYADAIAVNRHIKKYCLKEKRFGCIFCQYRSKRKDHIVRHSIRVHDTQLRQKIIEGEFAVPTDAVLKDGKLCEPEGATSESAMANETDFSLDFSVLYPEITDDAMVDEDDEHEPLPIKTELLESDDG